MSGPEEEITTSRRSKDVDGFIGRGGSGNEGREKVTFSTWGGGNESSCFLGEKKSLPFLSFPFPSFPFLSLSPTSSSD